jgi:4-amino-4-deoxy-L-arabinose transferase-like glycosyltransferase
MTKPPSRYEILCVAAISAIFCIFSLVTARRTMPVPDETLYADPGYNVIYNGHPGTTVLELAGYMSPTLQRHTYWPFPFCILMVAGWFGIFGFSLMKLRALSVVFGLVGVLSWYVVARKLSGSAIAALAAMSLATMDYFYLLQASNGRTDMLCAGLGAASLAVYLEMRARSLTRACFWSHVLATLSIATHADGLLYWLGLVVLIAVFDRDRISFRAVAFAAIPAVAGIRRIHRAVAG